LILRTAGKPIPSASLTLPTRVKKTPNHAGTIKEDHEWAAAGGYWLISLLRHPHRPRIALGNGWARRAPVDKHLSQVRSVLVNLAIHR
jgi:hypothetical protein